MDNSARIRIIESVEIFDAQNARQDRITLKL